MQAEVVAHRDGWRNATRVCLVGLGIALIVLTASGVWLWSRYVPTAAAAWPDVVGAAHSESWVRVTHRVASWITLTLGVVTLVLLIGRRMRTGGRGVVAGLGVVVTAVAAAFTGSLLPWDQLALWAVTVGGNTHGVSAVFDAKVKYVLVGSREISPGTYRFWAVTHVVLGVLVAVAAGLAWLRTRRATVSPEPPPDAPELVTVGQE